MSLREISHYRDPATGVEVTQLTNYRGHSHHFYFTNPGWYDQGRKLLFGSDRNNRPNLFGVDLATGDIEQFTDLDPTPLPHELEFVRCCKSFVKDEVYFFHGLELKALDLATRKLHTLHTLDPKWAIAQINGNADGRYVYFCSYVDQSDKFPVDLLRGYVGFHETLAQHPPSRIERVELATGRHEVVFEERYWIGHINASPTQPHALTFCHEGPWNVIDHRIWGFDGSTGSAWKIRPTEPPATAGHEYWFSDGKRVGYHGTNTKDQPVFGYVPFQGGEPFEQVCAGQTGHVFSLDETLIVGDGGGVIRFWRLINGQYENPRVLCRHHSGMKIQQTHPHPVLAPDGSHLIFTSDARTGYGNVYMVPLKTLDLEKLPFAKS